ncbi:hypothetical protein FYK55_26780 [Roseiconus nitratireducens]|uniref:Uncharacterized protein n=1 Tax=Roseiconus nitratireducens TaxID=2605748 RepID=A0A5M6CWF6_9BACT|nr:hypothetical protein [Roseiconus nitratireducens]KAA5538720.1 hypothetical protein FYK55_26780 [Roseiconus nitratireducens]
MPAIKAAAGYVRDDETVTTKELANRFGRSERWVKDTIRDADLIDVSYADLGSGLLLVSGRHFRLAVEAVARRQRVEREANQ